VLLSAVPILIVLCLMFKVNIKRKEEINMRLIDSEE